MGREGEGGDGIVKGGGGGGARGAKGSAARLSSAARGRETQENVVCSLMKNKGEGVQQGHTLEHKYSPVLCEIC